jgi:NAD+ diphosphatase
MKFNPSTMLKISRLCPDDALLLAFSGTNIILTLDGQLPQSTIHSKNLTGNFIYAGKLDGVECYAISLSVDAQIPSNLTYIDFRQHIIHSEPKYYTALARARGLTHWVEKYSYCGACGHNLNSHSSDFAQVCPQCQAIYYPKISPAIIVAVFNGNQILLAHNKNFRNGMYSTIAGFVDIGESLEQCVSREVLEETGIYVKNIRYFGSQPWPFPDSMMIGFTAEYDSGQLRPDGVEIIDAAWFRADNLPDIPSPGSISRQLIDHFVAKQPNTLAQQ